VLENLLENPWNRGLGGSYFKHSFSLILNGAGSEQRVKMTGGCLRQGDDGRLECLFT